ncbi:MAG: hypothetical protein KTR24_06090 [Saprospiraceae bacterium]|nr:hypothetical protein [Saprospiraceae bacterium]
MGTSETYIQRAEKERMLLLTKRSKAFSIYGVLGLTGALVGAAIGSMTGLFIGAVAAAIISGIAYWINIGQPYTELKQKVRHHLLQIFMETYHPEVKVDFYPEERFGRRIIRSSNLISPDIYDEEDVLEGTYKGSDFYMSEIELKNKSNKSTHTIFKGMLFRFSLPGRQFPTTRIQSKPGLLKRIFSRFVENTDFGFWYESEDPERLDQEVHVLYPFIRHLAEHQGDLRILLQGDHITLLMESDMNFLDDPKPSIGSSFSNPLYYEKMGQQLNSLLFILDAFIDNLESTDIEDRLELMLTDRFKIPQPIMNPLENEKMEN